MPTEKSVIKRAISTDGIIRVLFCDSTAIVKKSCEIHHTSKTMTAVLGRALTGTSLMSCLLKDKDNTLTLRFCGDGPAGNIVCVGDYMGNVRGYAENMKAELPPNADGKLDVGGAVGHGSMYVIKDMGLAEPYIGVSNIVSGEIAEDITNYFATSEQTPTVCALGVRVDKNNMCFAAGGYLVQLMPGYSDGDITKLEENIGKMDTVSKLLAEGKEGDEIIEMIFSDIEYQMFDEFDVDYVCPCDRERYLRALVSLNDADMDELHREGKDIETGCMFCGKKYNFGIDEIERERKLRREKSEKSESEAEKNKKE